MSPADRNAAVEAAFGRLSDAQCPYARFLGVTFERRGDELTARLAYDPKLIGNPILPALHGGTTGAFLEIAAITELAWARVLGWIDEGGERAEAIAEGRFPPLPKPIDISVDYLRSGRPQQTWARATVLRQGRRIAYVRMEAWQEERGKPIVCGHGHFLLPDANADAEGAA